MHRFPARTACVTRASLRTLSNANRNSCQTRLEILPTRARRSITFEFMQIFSSFSLLYAIIFINLISLSRTITTQRRCLFLILVNLRCFCFQVNEKYTERENKRRLKYRQYYNKCFEKHASRGNINHNIISVYRISNGLNLPGHNSGRIIHIEAFGL